MKIICLEGPNHIGKTTAINEVYNIISQCNCKEIKQKEQVGKELQDFKAEIEYYQNDSTLKKIAFYSMGDEANKVLEVISYYLTDGSFDYLIIANREFKTVRKEILKNQESIILTNKETFSKDVLRELMIII